jgi:hypothetical protein
MCAEGPAPNDASGKKEGGLAKKEEVLAKKCSFWRKVKNTGEK